jgi:hypothetical protein
MRVARASATGSRGVLVASVEAAAATEGEALLSVVVHSRAASTRT